jgi:hypothetical protein
MCRLRCCVLAPSLLAIAALGSPARAQTLVSLAGDRDGFGLGIAAGGSRPVSAGFFDRREESDPPFTDARPVLVANPRDFEYEHRFEPPIPAPDGRAVAAALRLFTLGVQDGDQDVAGSDKDLRIFLDGVEVAGAFDAVDQFAVDEGGVAVEMAGDVEIAIPASVLALLEDGRVAVRLTNTDLLRPEAGDAFAIDFSELVVQFARGDGGADEDDAPAGQQVPGDCDQDGLVAITDAVCFFGFLFLGEPAALPCGDGGASEAPNLELLDFDRTARLDLADGILLLDYLFRGGAAHPLGVDCAAIAGCPDACAG